MSVSSAKMDEITLRGRPASRRVTAPAKHYYIQIYTLAVPISTLGFDAGSFIIIIMLCAPSADRCVSGAAWTLSE